MANIKINLDTPTNQRWSGGLPVEIRDLNRAVLQARGVSGGSIDVPPGRYLVTATLPDGRQAGGSKIVELEAETDSKEVALNLTSDLFPALLAQTAPWTDSLKAAANTVSSLVTSRTSWLTSRPCALVRGVRLGNLLDVGLNSAPPDRAAVVRSTIDVPAANETVLMEIGAASSGCDYFTVPVDASGHTTAQWEIDAKAQTSRVRFDFNGPATAFFDYVQDGLAPQAKTLSRELVQQGESYFKNAGSSLSALSATLAAYVLLRLNDLDQLNEWTTWLRQYHGDVPDTLPIRAEYLGRTGRHREAANLLLDLPRIGIPWFRSGLVYAAGRAKYYNGIAGQAEGSLDLKQTDKHLYEKISPKLASLAEKLDFSASTTVLRGLPRLS